MTRPSHSTGDDSPSRLDRPSGQRRPHTKRVEQWNRECVLWVGKIRHVVTIAPIEIQLAPVFIHTSPRPAPKQRRVEVAEEGDVHHPSTIDDETNGVDTLA
jgi:hypothetical protein